MPELPEVETVKQGLIPAMEGQVLESITLNRPDLRVPITDGFAERLSGQKLVNLIRRGKYILGFVEGGQGFVLHLGMSGRIKIYGPDKAYESEKHDHVVFHMQSGAQIVLNDPRRFGMLYLTDQQRWEQEPPFAFMGPEPLGNAFSGPVLYETLKKRKAPIKNALLDQHVVAGVGNIYACEALYDSDIHPQTPCYKLKKTDYERLVPAIKDVLARAIASGGSSLRDYKKTDGSLGYFQYNFSVYDKEGVACPDCQCNIDKTGGVQRIVQSGRSTFFCPEKQKA